MLKGRCPNCGSVRYGWALQNVSNRTCHKCGTRLKIEENDDKCPDVDQNVKIIESEGLEGDNLNDKKYRDK